MTKTEIEDYFNSNKKPTPTYPHSVVIDHDAVDTGPAQYAPMEAAPVPVFKAPAEDYTDFSKRPPATYGSSVVVGRDDTRGMSEQVPAAQTVAAPTWIDPNAVPQMSGFIPNNIEDIGGGRDGRGWSFSEMAPVQPNYQIPAPQTAFNPAFVDITAPTQDTRSGTYPQAAIANILRDTAGNPVMSGNGNPIGLPNQSTGNAATGGKGGAGGK